VAVSLWDTTATAIVLLTGCGPAQQQAATAAAPAVDVQLPSPASAAEIERITIARAPILGEPGPSYSLDLTDQGGARRYEGANGAPQMRSFTAPLDTALFRRVAQRMIDDGFFRWPSEQQMIRKGPVLSITAWMTRDRFHNVAGRAGVHMALGAALDSLASSLQWTPDTLRGTDAQ
jgi:hypothetical protein